ncbi:MAG: TlyA family RNA methyltransferase [Pseudomonadota bacterium]
MSDRIRIDLLLVDRGIFDSRAAARASVDAGLVFADGRQITKASVMVSPSADIMAEPAHPFVSRGGLKLSHALDRFNVNPTGWRCVDLGASTGGFTDVLLKRGAVFITAVDVGRDQLHTSLRKSEQVLVREETDIRKLTAQDIGPDVRLLVADLSFISLVKALHQALNLVGQGCHLVALFKPQFEVGRKAVGKGGVVKDAGAVNTARLAFETWLTEIGWTSPVWTESPIKGANGNQEYLLHSRKGLPTAS